MTLEMGLVLAILLAAIVLFVTEWMRVDMVALGVVVLLMLSGVLTTQEALAGFSNGAVVTIAALFVIGGAVMRTGLADLIGRQILNIAGRNERTLPLVLMLTAALLSSVMSDTGTVAVLLPVVIMLAQKAKIAPSRLLMPMAFGSLLGGAMTLIGTPPNIIVSDVLRENGYVPFHFFSYTPLGLVMLLLGVGFVGVFGRRLLPKHQTKQVESPSDEAQRVIADYHLHDEMARLRVRRGSSLVGQTVAAANLRHDYEIDVINILRPSQPRAELSLLGYRNGNGKVVTPVMPDADTTIGLDDVLLVRGEPRRMAKAAVHHNLGVQTALPDDEHMLVGEEAGVAEIVLPRESRLLGRTLAHVHFQEAHGLNVLCVFRPNHGQIDDTNDLKLQFGDVLIVHGTWDNVYALKKHPRDYIVLGQPEAMIKPPAREKAGWAAAILIGMVIAMAGEWLPLTQTALVAAGAVVLIGCINMDQAYRAIDWKSVVLIAGMIPMSTALTNVGLVDAMAHGLVQLLGQAGPLAMLAGLFVLTAVFTQFLSNTATVVVVAPIALTAAQSLGVQPQAFMMGIAIAGSMAFASPVASPVNTLVMGAGNYSFSDYMRLGIPLLILSFLVAILGLPLLFPF